MGFIYHGLLFNARSPQQETTTISGERNIMLCDNSVTSLRLAQLTKLRQTTNNLSVKCDAYLRADRTHFERLLYKYGVTRNTLN
jgi:hypothetical protein